MRTLAQQSGVWLRQQPLLRGLFLFEVPSNLAIQKVGARLWIPRIAIAGASSPWAWRWFKYHVALYRPFSSRSSGSRLLPRRRAYLTTVDPARYRAHCASLCRHPGMLSLSGLILSLDGWLGLRGWHLLFIIEGLPEGLRCCCWVCGLVYSPGSPSSGEMAQR